MQKTSKKYFLYLLLVISSFVWSIIGINLMVKTPNMIYADSTESEEIEYGDYLSNITPITQTIGYDTLKLDKNLDGSAISFIVNGERKYFDKGIIAHATSTLVYDLGENHNYDYFSTYLGIDASKEGKGNVKISVYTSNDNTNWITVLQPTVCTSNSEAIYLKVDMKDVRYLKFYFDSNGDNGYDHSGLGDCKLYSNGYNFDKEENLINKVEYYDNLFKGKTTQEILSNYNLELMQRKFIDSVGYDTLRNSFLIGESEPERREMLTWLYKDSTALRDFVTGGKPNGGNYINALKVLTRLYKAHNEDLNDKNALFEPETGSTRNRGDVYRTMMISIALTNAKDVYGWVNSGDILDPLARYEAIKYTYLDETYHLRYDIFENLCVEEMRYLMSSRINSEEIYWLNAYSTIKYLDNHTSINYPDVYSPHRHIRYGRDWDYGSKGYYKEENFEQYNQKYMLEQFGVSLTSTPRLWMVMEGSQICWGISYLGTNFASAYGIPSHYVRQPDHAAFFVYNKDSNGRTVWSIDNDIFGWTQTWMNEDVVGNGNYRMMCDWGTNGDEQVTHSNGSYILLAATALDHQENYETAELILSLKSSTDQDNQEQLFRYALTFMPYHFDAWYELVKLYINTNKSDEELTTLAEEIAQNMYCFPLPMNELIALINNELIARNTNSSIIQLAKVRNIDNMALQKATKVDEDESAKDLIAQTSPCIEEAKYLLGLVEEEKLATFSFDGENQNKLVFNSKYTNVRYIYSIDGGTTWSDSLVTTSEDITHLLSKDELDCITSANDIYIWLEGWGTIVDLNKAFKIDIVDGSEISNLEANDNENRFLGTFTNIEYSLDNSYWQDLTEESVFIGNQQVYVRNKRTGVILQGETSTFVFTDNTNVIRNYIPISCLELYDYSSEETSMNDYAKYVIDGKLSTRWHTRWSGGDVDRYVTIKFDKKRYISGIDYTPVGGNGTMYACDVYVSVDGENWTLATSVSNWNNDNIKKQLTFTPIYCQYIKIVGTNTVGGYCSARLIEFFEDTTIYEKQASKLEIANLPKCDTYVLGQNINYQGLKVQIVFDDNSTAIIPNQLLTLENVTFTKIGNNKITIKYDNNLQTTFEVSVIDIEDSVARIGMMYYSSLDGAISSILDGGTSEEVIELLKDVTLDKGYIITKNITINGNNHILKRNAEYISVFFNVSGTSKLILNNITLDGGAVWSGDINECLNRGTTNDGVISTSPLIKMIDTSMLVLNNCILQNNYNNYSTNAQNAGGAIFLGSSSNVTLNNTTIKNCYSATFGSAIYTRDNATLTINSGVFTANSGNSSRNTTVICVDNNSSCIINGGKFVNNLAYEKGGVFWVSNGKLDINGGLFKDNYSTLGSTIYLNGAAKINISNFDEIDEVYLPSGKNINILSPLYGKTLYINMSNNAMGETVAICDDEEIKYKVLKALVVKGRLLYIDGNNIKIGDPSTAKTSINSGDKETLFISLIEALKSAQQNDVINLKDNIVVNEKIYIEIPLTINLSDYILSGIENIDTRTLCKIAYSDNLIKVCDHNYVLNITYTWNEDYSYCTAVAYCECGEKYEETIKSSDEIIVPASYDSEEITTYVAEFTYSEFSKQEISVVTGPRLVKPQEDNDKTNARDNSNMVVILSICGGIVVFGIITFIIVKCKYKKIQ